MKHALPPRPLYEAFANTSCRDEPVMGIDWMPEDLPTGADTAEQVAEWLRRERCDVCGKQGAGCVVIDRVEIYAEDDQADDEAASAYSDHPPGTWWF